jgi:Mce-associated membrane protein
LSSSDDRRRPRVAGQRRRHGRPAGDPAATGPAETLEPVETVEPVEPELPTAAEPGASAPVEDPRPVVEDAEEVEDAEGREDAAAGPDLEDEDTGEQPGRRLPAGAGAPLAALVLALVAFALVLTVSLKDPGAREADARAATATARTSLEQLLSYSYQTLDQQAAANAALLTGAFKGEYAKTMSTTIAPVAVKDEVTVRARSYEAGVMGQTPDTVTVQVFLNQAKTAKGEEQPSVDQNRVIATMRRVEGRWLIEKLSAY